MTPVTLKFARTVFERFQNNETAGVYLRTLMEYEADDRIGDDDFLDGLADIANYLNPKMAQHPSDDGEGDLLRANERDQQDPAADWMKR